MNKTFLLIFAIAVAGFIGLNAWKSRAQEPALQEKAEYEVTKTDAEWKEILSPEAYRVLRHHDTERPGSSNINDVKEDGTFYCAVATCPSLIRRPSSIPEQGGLASFNLRHPKRSVKKWITSSFYRVRRFTVHGVGDTWDMSLMTDQSLLGKGFASMVYP